MQIDYPAWFLHVASFQPEVCKVPKDNNTKAVAILNHEKAPGLSNTAADFIWFKCKAKQQLSKLRTIYKERSNCDEAIVLCCAGIVGHEGLRIGDIENDGTPGIVILEAVEEKDLPRRTEISTAPPPRQDHSLRQDVAKIKTKRDPLRDVSPNKRPADHADDGKKTEPTETLVPVPHPNVKPTGASVCSHSPSSDSYQSTAAPVEPPYKRPPQTPLAGPPLRSGSNSEHCPVHPVQQKLVSPAAIAQDVPASQLPSKRLPNQNVNRPFLKYLDHYYMDSASVRSLSLSALVDHVWSKWQSLPERSEEKSFFTKPVSFQVRNGELIGNDRALEDTKPEVPQDTSNSQPETTRLLFDFKAEFEKAENSMIQTPEQKRRTGFKIQDITDGASLEELETFVTRGVRWLNAIKAPLGINKSASQEAANWLKMCDQIESYATRTKTVIGVVGNTGAGKSSVINALLNQEQLLPTNTMRACTAVVTEIAYNFEAGRAFRAEIEFIDEKSWADELGVLFSDLITSDGKINKEISTTDSDAGIAYAKIKAVYPKKTKDDIVRSTVSNLIKEVSNILGKTQKVQDDDSLVFYKRLQKYIDSQEKVAANKSTEDRKAPREMELWPLIKVVRIYCRSEALATGAIIVDLPGVHDANAARAAVAEGYMKQCSGLWIVAPIIRAVDDKAAKNLLGSTFKRQLKMDGGFNQVTFICSKTDDISLMEATTSLGLEETNEPLWAEADHQAALQADLNRKLKEHIASRDAIEETREGLADQIETWEALRDRFEDGGEPLYAPAIHKRKSRGRESPGRKKSKRSRRRTNDSDISSIGSESEFEESSDDDDDDAEVSVRKPLTMDEISEQISKLREQDKNARKERADLNDNIADFKAAIKKSVRAQKEAESVIAERCIKGRNNYSKEAIRQDFAAGVRELDQEKAQEENEDAFDPEEEARDYDEVARSLPVFCVSSRGYQQLCGKRKKDAAVHGFTELEQTEIPALQAHCRQLTVSGRTAACNKFLLNISHLANSLAIWASSDGTNNHLTPEQRGIEEKFLAKSFKNLNNALERLTATIVRDLATEIESNVVEKFDVACHFAENKAVATSDRWGDRPNSERPSQGGYVWATYKAVCRRHGAYTNHRGPIAFNDQLAEPMMVHILAGWERLFVRRIPSVLSNLGKNLSHLLKTFHSDVATRSQLSGAGTATIPMLEQQLVNYEHVFDASSREARTRIDSAQRDINREFVPSITNSMIPGYIKCVDERGEGSFRRMKSHMHDHVTQIRVRMFRACCASVKAALKKVLHQVKEDLENASGDIFRAIQRDYRSAFNGVDLKPGEALPRWQREKKKAVASLVEHLKEYLTLEVPPKVEINVDEATILRQFDSLFTFATIKPEEEELSTISNTITQGANVNIEANNRAQIHGVVNEDDEEDASEEEDEEDEEEDYSVDEGHSEVEEEEDSEEEDDEDDPRGPRGTYWDFKRYMSPYSGESDTD